MEAPLLMYIPLYGLWRQGRLNPELQSSIRHISGNSEMLANSSAGIQTYIDNDYVGRKEK
jgi:hypothetical protein